MIKIFSIKGVFNYMIIAGIISYIVTFAIGEYLHVEKEMLSVIFAVMVGIAFCRYCLMKVRFNRLIHYLLYPAYLGTTGYASYAVRYFLG
tara:strand:- start:518 stop:787 length:270 start_codon:yes stop_codon:yes gene_type:complete